MEIFWLGQSSARLVSNDVALITDPFADAPAGSDAQIVAITHHAPTLPSRADLGEDARIIDGPGQYEALGYNITGIGTALNDEEGSRRINTVYVIRSEGVSVCHLGALSAKLSARHLDSLGSIDVLLTPTRGRGGLGTSQIVQLANVLNPRIVIPVGYEVDDESEEEQSPLDALLDQMKVERPDPQPRLNVTRTNLPRESRVVILTPRRR